MERRSILIPKTVYLLANFDADNQQQFVTVEQPPHTVVEDSQPQDDSTVQNYYRDNPVFTCLEDAIIKKGSWNLRNTAPPLPDNVIVEGDFILSKYLKTLPKNLQVKGTLDLSKAVNLRQFPVDGSLKANKIIIGDASITTIPSYLQVRTIDAADSLVSKIESGLIVKNLNLRNCKHLRRLPSNLTVKGLLTLTGTRVTDIPKMSRIRAVDIRDCPVKSVPKGVDIYNTPIEQATDFGRNAYKYFVHTLKA